jgi:FdhD protein
MAVELHNALFFNGNEFSRTEDFISIETALRISINKKEFTLTMQTPGNEFDLDRGLLFTEGVYGDLLNEPLYHIEEKDAQGYITAINVEVPPHLVLKDFSGKRQILSGSSCGVCGKVELDESQGLTIKTGSPLNPTLVSRMFDQIQEAQIDFQKSGGTHAAGAFNAKGDKLTVQEDIGRHNAVDKVIGHLIKQRLLDEAVCITVSGRISYEIVNKIKMAGIPYLAAVSAPSSLAIKNAHEAGICLMAFCRNKKLTVYSNPQNIYHPGVTNNTLNHVI